LDWFGIVFIHQVKRSDIGQVVTVFADNPKVGKGAVFVVEQFKHVIQPRRCRQLIPGICLGDDIQFGGAFFYKKLDNFTVMGQLGFERVDDAGFLSSSLGQVSSPG